MITSFFAPKSKRAAGGRTDESDTSLMSENKRQRTADASSPPDLSPHVKELLSHMHCCPDDAQTWRNALLRHTSGPSFSTLAKFVASERKSQTVYPPACDTFSALNLTPLQDVKVVIVGQDPYHGPLQAHGLAFSVRRGVPVPASLKNIYKELLNDDDIDFSSGGRMPTHGSLERWAKQGVLMLNSVLTVRKGEAHSHKNRGWEKFTDEIIRIVDRQSNKGLVFLLWGKPASKKAEALLHGGSKHKVICTSHPSPLGATKTKSPFLGSRCFSKTNEALLELGHGKIDWNVDGDL